jgi:hypothetical protein
MELQHLSIEVLGRISQYLGSHSVRRLRFVQITAVRAPLRSAPRRIEVAAPESVAGMAAGPLQAALAALGRAVVSESASRLGKQLHTKR